MTFSIVAVLVLLASTNASGLELDGTTNPGIFSLDNTFGPGPYATCGAPAVCAGTGTNAFSWGTPAATVGSTNSSLRETGFSFEDAHVANTPPGGPDATKIVIGHLTFTNGMTVAGTEVADVYLKISTGGVFIAGSDPPVPDPSNPTHANTDFRTLHLEINNTVNSPNPLEPDIIKILSGQCNAITSNTLCVPGSQFDQFSVVEGETATVELLGFLGSLETIGFGQVDDPTKGFVSSSAVPEPSSLMLVGGGLIAMILARHRNGLRRPDTGRCQ